jgi:hypothetical protein
VLAAGVAAGLGLLEKPSGLFLPAVFLAALLPRGGVDRRVVVRRLVLLHAPFAAALALYLARNWLAYGSLSFRFSVLEWIWKVRGFEGAYALFEEPPALLATLQSIGWSRAVGIGVEQVEKLIRLAVTAGFLRPAPTAPALLLPLALVTLPLHWPRSRGLVRMTLAATVGSVAFICFCYHTEIRYFYFLGPLAYVLVAGLLHEGMRVALSGRAARLANIALCIASVGFLCVVVLRAPRTKPRVPGLESACQTALVEATRPGEAVLAIRPSQTAWRLDRPVVNVPSGGVEAIGRVARHYGARWILVERAAHRPRTTEVLFALDGRLAGGLTATVVFSGPRCRVVRLDW